jgi:hypothetical protein
MDGIVAHLSRCDKRKWHERVRKCRDAASRNRYLLVVNLAEIDPA